MKIGVIYVELAIDSAQSLKQKRQVVKSLKERLFSRFNVSVKEIGSQNKWQRAELGLALVALDGRGADVAMRAIEDFIEAHPGAQVLELQRGVFDPEG